jgi:hypothetical protein
LKREEAEIMRAIGGDPSPKPESAESEDSSNKIIKPEANHPKAPKKPQKDKNGKKALISAEKVTAPEEIKEPEP